MVWDSQPIDTVAKSLVCLPCMSGDVGLILSYTLCFSWYSGFLLQPKDELSADWISKLVVSNFIPFSIPNRSHT